MGLKGPFYACWIVAALIISNGAFACAFDTDCQPGSKCAKATNAVYGVCVGGLMPGNSNDRRPVTDPLDVNRTYGNTCSFSTDCGPGSMCMKDGGIYGTCMKSR